MIVVRLIGGLGNQLFQYAMGKQLAIRNGKKLYLDISGYEKDVLREYELKHFNIGAEIISSDDFKAQKADSLKEKCKSWLRDTIDFRKIPRIKWLRERQFCFDEEICNKKLDKDIYLSGYWQCEKYFLSSEDFIRQDFSIKSPISKNSLAVANQIKASNCPVSLHVRRGDYVGGGSTGLCSLKYYEKCIEELKKEVGSFTLVIFSDDMLWVKENFCWEMPMIFVDHNGPETAYEDLFLMSQCDHNIIANSSFSWWGAWLNPNKSKLVYGPTPWFANSKLDTKDVMPIGWKKFEI